MSGFPKSGGGTVKTVNNKTPDTNGNVDLSSLFLSYLSGEAEPLQIQTLIAGATFTPDMTVANRAVITTGGASTISMPAVQAGKKASWWLRLINPGTDPEPTWDPNVTWVGVHSTRQSGAGKWDLYYFETEVGGAPWWGYQVLPLFPGASYLTFATVAAAGVPTPAAGFANVFMDSADSVVKTKDSNGELHVMMVHLATTSPTNVAIPWVDNT